MLAFCGSLSNRMTITMRVAVVMIIITTMKYIVKVTSTNTITMNKGLD